jgi:photosystem II stability/assembly factor-like uncharacterized protein
VFKAICSARDASGATRRTRSHLTFFVSAVALFAAALLTIPALSTRALGAPTTTRSSATAVIDYSTGFGPSTPATLKKAGVGVVIRYVGSSAWKCLTPAEATALRREGIDIATVYETSAGWMLGGRRAGIAAARAARAAIIADGGPAQPFVYFACDVDTDNFSAVNAALQGAQSVLGAENVGIYGSYSVCLNALETKSAAKAWQTVAWSDGKLLPEAALLQLIPRTLGNLGLDYDANIRYADDIGQWGLPTTATPAPIETVSFTPQPTPTTATLRSVESTDGVTAWAVGDRGTILHTNSAGATWTVQSTPTSATLHAVDFADRTNGWAAGEQGTILRTADGGLHWNGQSTPTTSTLNSIHFTNSWSGWAVGESGTVLHTGDGGVTWTAQSAPATTTLTSVDFSSETTGVAMGEDGAFLFTGNAGRSWFQASTPTTSTLLARVAVSPGVAWSVGARGAVIRTGNDGATWGLQSVPTTATLHSLGFADSSRGVAVGASGTVLFTRDAGHSWAKSSVDTTGSLNGVEFIGKSGWAVGDNGKVFRLQTSVN